MDGVGQVNRARTVVGIALIAVALLLVLFTLRPSTSVQQERAEPLPADTTPHTGLVTRKWSDCFKSCTYWFEMQLADGTTERYSPQKPLYDHVAVGAKVKLAFTTSSIGMPLLSGLDVLEAPPPPPPEPPPQAPVPAPMPQAPVAHHAGKHK